MSDDGLDTFETAVCYHCGKRIRVGTRHTCSKETQRPLRGEPNSIVADTREKLSHPYPTTYLEIGDYLITTKGGSTILVERKSWSDLAGSFAAQRLQQQLWRMAREGQADHMVLVVEESYIPKRAYRLYKSALNYVKTRVEPVFYVKYTDSYEETCKVMEYWAKHGDSVFYCHRPAKKAPAAADLLMAVPGVGEATRDKIVRSKRFKSFVDFVKNVHKLKGVLPPRQVEKIKEYFRESWK